MKNLIGYGRILTMFNVHEHFRVVVSFRFRGAQTLVWTPKNISLRLQNYPF
jgi:hypothetical protein